ncbi:MAG: rhodanese-like domain-containing protein [Actinomycetota bacterium]
MSTPTASVVTEAPAATPAAAIAHFEHLLAFETDCADVKVGLGDPSPDFVLLDVRSAEAFAAGHIDGATNLPRVEITTDSLDALGDTTFVVYCAGPHCNGADKAALRIARLGRPVKKMIGGVTGWLDEGFELVAGQSRDGGAS